MLAMCLIQRHPTAKNRPLAGLVLQILQNSDRALLTGSVQVTDDDVMPDSQSMMLHGSSFYCRK